jgi:hypothetical protein
LGCNVAKNYPTPRQNLAWGVPCASYKAFGVLRE